MHAWSQCLALSRLIITPALSWLLLQAGKHDRREQKPMNTIQASACIREVMRNRGMAAQLAGS